jgi:hypothetical protein
MIKMVYNSGVLLIVLLICVGNTVSFYSSAFKPHLYCNDFYGVYWRRKISSATTWMTSSQ